MTRQLTILDLPVNIRERICDYAGFTGHTSDLNYAWLDLYPLNEYPNNEHVAEVSCFHGTDVEIFRRVDPDTFEEYWEYPYDWCTTLENLFPPLPSRGCYTFGCEWTGSQVCSDYYDDGSTHPELVRIMMQKNHFRICQGSPGGFEPFFELASDPVKYRVLAELGTLTVRLDGEPPESIVMGGDWSRLPELIPYNLRSRYGKAALKEWKRLISRLAQCIRPNQLTLYVIAKAQDIETASAILEPLLMLPALKGCGVYLNEKDKPGFVTLIKRTAKSITSPEKSANITPFRYLDLPQELRFRILEFSDLKSNDFFEFKPSLRSIAPIPDPQFSCCTASSGDARSLSCPEGYPAPMIDKANINRYVWGFSSLKQYERSLSGHCCSTRESTRSDLCAKDSNGFCACVFDCAHSAYCNTISQLPTKIYPHPLLHTSHTVRQDAIPVFFQCNEFIITPPGVLPMRFNIYPNSLVHHLDQKSIQMRRTELSIFLSWLPTNSLKYIRYLEWVIPRVHAYTSAAFDDYITTIEMMTHAMNLSQLTLVINFRGLDLDCLLDKNYVIPDDDFEYYRAMLKPLRRLAGLKDCFVYLRRPSLDNWETTASVIFIEELEREYEAMVMGDEYYDSRDRAKSSLDSFQRRILWGLAKSRR
ncbi:Nn.00g061850.m01.CDS01 [Neocucurbitaria sp. VM-36]